MKIYGQIRAGFSQIRRYHFHSTLLIAACWTLIDLVYWVKSVQNGNNDGIYQVTTMQAIVTRACFLFIMSGFLVYILIFRLRETFRNYPLILSLLLKTALLFAASFLMNFILQLTYSQFVIHQPVGDELPYFLRRSTSFGWFLRHGIGWVVLFVLTQLIIEVNEKYAPGVFLNLLIGKYIEPKNEERIILFIDLVNSTPIAEKLGSKRYFRFIRDFIYFFSLSILEYKGSIYQYVGDEIIVSWLHNSPNIKNCIKSLIYADKQLKRNKRYFLANYGVIPEFKAGIHAGIVTVGEIGIIKKDLAMSGDTVNTTARIRDACTQFSRKCIISKKIMTDGRFDWEAEYLGDIDLKGKRESVELYALKI